MLVTDLYTAQIPDIYQRLANIIGESHWKVRVREIESHIKGNKLLASYLRQENLIAFQLEGLRRLSEKFGKIHDEMLNNRDFYPAVGFAAQVLSIMDTAPKELVERIRRRVHGAIKKPNDMRAIQLELTVATHFTRRGYNVVWPEMEGSGTFDIYIEGLGTNGLEIECKTVSEDKGKKVHRREAIDFYKIVQPEIAKICKGLRIGVFAVLTVSGRLPTSHTDRLKLANRLVTQILRGQSMILPDNSHIRVGAFDCSLLSSRTSKGLSLEALRTAVDSATNTINRNVMLFNTKAGGYIVIAIQSAADDTLMKAVFDTLSDSSKRQVSGKRSAMFFVGFQGIDGAQLLSVAGQDNDPTQPPTVLRREVSRFLSSDSREHVVAVAFASESCLIPVEAGLVDSGGITYYFPKRESSYWSEDFNGLFSWS